MPLLVALARAGLSRDRTAEVRAAAAAPARRRNALLAPGGSPADLARRLGRTIPLVYGSAGVTAVAAQWWKTQVNLNAKAPAFAHVAGADPRRVGRVGPGWRLTRQTMSLVLLRHAGEGPRTGGLFAAVRAATDEVMADVFDVEGDGDDDRPVFDLTLQGTLVSLHLAAREAWTPDRCPSSRRHKLPARCWAERRLRRRR